jgi:hypothetical protein
MPPMVLNPGIGKLGKDRIPGIKVHGYEEVL